MKSNVAYTSRANTQLNCKLKLKGTAKTYLRIKSDNTQVNNKLEDQGNRNANTFLRIEVGNLNKNSRNLTTDSNLNPTAGNSKLKAPSKRMKNIKKKETTVINRANAWMHSNLVCYIHYYPP